MDYRILSYKLVGGRCVCFPTPTSDEDMEKLHIYPIIGWDQGLDQRLKMKEA